MLCASRTTAKHLADNGMSRAMLPTTAVTTTGGGRRIGRGLLCRLPRGQEETISCRRR